MSDGQTDDALDAAFDNFAELIRALDKAIEDARGTQDSEIIDRLAAAKATAERGQKRIRELRGILDAGTGRTPAVG